MAFGLLAAAAIMFFPQRWTAPMKSAAAGALRPGQVAALAVRQRVASLVGRARRHWDTVAQLAESQALVEKLREANRGLAAALETQRACKFCPPADPAAEAAQRLLHAGWMEARVLGQQARAFLARQHVLDVGWRAGVGQDALVLDRPPVWIDLGNDAGVEAGGLAVSDGRVWGKIVEVGACTSVVRTVTEPGYRDVVRLARPDPEGSRRLGPQGVLEGTGQALARVRLIEAAEPVALGDLVCSEAAKGVVSAPLVYGRVVRLERPVGAAYWEIWMEPAVRSPQPDRVAVLRPELNPRRIAARAGATARRQASRLADRTSEVSKTSEVYEGTASGEAVAHRKDADGQRE